MSLSKLKAKLLSSLEVAEEYAKLEPEFEEAKNKIEVKYSTKPYPNVGDVFKVVVPFKDYKEGEFILISETYGHSEICDMCQNIYANIESVNFMLNVYDCFKGVKQEF